MYFGGTGYLLSKKEGRIGSPEKPLSGLGALSYANYWKLTLFQYLHDHPNSPVKFEDISKATSMTMEDILTMLTKLDMITIRDEPAELLAKKQNAVSLQRASGGAARQAVSREDNPHNGGSPGSCVVPLDYDITWNTEEVDAYLEKQGAKGYYTLKPGKLKYTPFLVQRSGLDRDVEQQQPESDQVNINTPNEHVDEPNGTNHDPVGEKNDDAEIPLQGEQRAELAETTPRPALTSLDEEQRVIKALIRSDQDQIPPLTTPRKTRGRREASATSPSPVKRLEIIETPRRRQLRSQYGAASPGKVSDSSPRRARATRSTSRLSVQNGV